MTPHQTCKLTRRLRHEELEKESKPNTNIFLKSKTQHPFNKEIKWRNMIQKNNWVIIGKQN